jgi:hypothetical protein
MAHDTGTRAALLRELLSHGAPPQSDGTVATTPREAVPPGLGALPFLARARARPAAAAANPGSAARVHLPDTVVFGLDPDDPFGGVWLRTGSDGCVRQEREFAEIDVIQSMCGVPDQPRRHTERSSQRQVQRQVHDDVNPDTHVVALCKTPSKTGTDVQLVTESELKTIFGRRGGGVFAVQHLVKPARHRTAFCHRVRWRGGSASGEGVEGWIVANRLPVVDLHTGAPGGFVTDAATPHAAEGTDLEGGDEAAVGGGSSITKARGAVTVGGPAVLCEALAVHLGAVCRPPARVVELIADFTRDAQGTWWLLQVPGPSVCVHLLLGMCLGSQSM